MHSGHVITPSTSMYLLVPPCRRADVQGCRVALDGPKWSLLQVCRRGDARAYKCERDRRAASGEWGATARRAAIRASIHGLLGWGVHGHGLRLCHLWKQHVVDAWCVVQSTPPHSAPLHTPPPPRPRTSLSAPQRPSYSPSRSLFRYPHGLGCGRTMCNILFATRSPNNGSI